MLGAILIGFAVLEAVFTIFLGSNASGQIVGMLLVNFLKAVFSKPFQALWALFRMLRRRRSPRTPSP